MIRPNYLKRNLRLYYITELTRSLILTIPIWVAFELRYINFSQLTIIEAILFGTQLVLELPTGALADLIGRKKTIMIAFVISGIGQLVFGYSNSFNLFILYAIISGIGEALFSGSRDALIYDTLKEHGQEGIIDKISSKGGVIFQFGLAFASIAGGFLYVINYHLPFVIYGGILLVSGLLSLLFVEPHLDSEKFTLKSYIKQTKIGVQEILQNQYTKAISLFYIAVGAISWSCMMLFNTTILVNVGHSPQEIGIISGIVRIFNSIVLFKLLNIGRLFDWKKTVIFFPVVMMISLLPGMFLSKWIVIPFYAGSMIASTARWVILGKYVNQVYSSKNRATTLSTLSMAIGLFYMAIALLSGPILQGNNGPRLAYTVMGVLTILLILPISIKLVKDHSHTYYDLQK